MNKKVGKKTNKNKKNPYVKPGVLGEEKMVIAFCKVCCATDPIAPRQLS